MNEALLSSKNLSWCTPVEFFKELDQEFHFDLDPAATDKSAKCARYFTPADDGLTKDWGGSRVFCNPPYGRNINEWVRKGYEESQKPGTVVVMLIPARTDTSYYHDYIFGGKADEVRFLRGRLVFTDEDGSPARDAKGHICSAPFPSAVIIWRSPDTAQNLRDVVLDLIKGKPMTANEIAATLSDRGQQVNRSDVGPILTKAQAAGKAKNAGKRVCSVTGRSAIVWTAGSEENNG